jgi:hypothetical protein
LFLQRSFGREFTVSRNRLGISVNLSASACHQREMRLTQALRRQITMSNIFGGQQEGHE